MKPRKLVIEAHKTHEVSKQTLGGFLPNVLNQVSDEGDGSHPGFVTSGKREF